jgi:hypothetical protein
MARSAASIQAEITAIENMLSSAESLYTTVSATGGSRTIDRTALQTRLDQLYQQLGRATGAAPMIVRGVVKGLR